MNAPELAASRPLGVARELTGTELDAEAVFGRKVVLIGEASFLQHQNGRWCFENALRLLSRTIGELEVVVPAGFPEFRAHVQRLVETVFTQRRVRLVNESDGDLARAAAVLNIGPSARAGLPWTAAVSNGWVARCSSCGPIAAHTLHQANPLGALLAASLGVTEVFKRVYSIPMDEFPPYDDEAFSLFTLSTEFENDGPPLPTLLKIPSTLLLGAGAIGNGIALLATQLALTGPLYVLDKQDFGKENHGTCCLLDDVEWLGHSKAEMLARWMKESGGPAAEGLQATIQDALKEDSFNRRNFDLVINGLDDIAARRDVQTLWPSLLVDGGINSIGASVVTHSLAHPQYACMRCTFAEPTIDAQAAQARVTGLSGTTLAADPNRKLTDADIESAAAHMQPWLREQQEKGATICSVIAEGMAKRLGLNLKDGFRPSVPFVATASASLVMSQVLRGLYWPAETFIHEVQFASLFLGPHTEARVRRRAAEDCLCSKKRSVIEDLVAERQKLALGGPLVHVA